ncbi:DoxX family protein [Aurantimonas sp. Leaf443]|uniref:DoxX family protein n=1 Tax=Aurantimonas sp. Leaf443 TaxID=1736378 RepID=UPI00329728E0
MNIELRPRRLVARPALGFKSVRTARGQTGPALLLDPRSLAVNSTVLLVGRILLSIIFLVGGFGKLTGAEGFAGYLGVLGFPAPLAMAYLVGLFELAGGLAVLVGFKTTIAGYALAAFCIATGVIAHMAPDQMTTLLKNVGLAGGYLVLAAAGPGAYSVDARSSGARSSSRL